MWDSEFIYSSNIRPLKNLLPVRPRQTLLQGIKTLIRLEPVTQLLEPPLQVHVTAEAQNPVALKKRPYLPKEPAR